MERGDSGEQSCGPALRWGAHLDGGRRGLPDGHTGRGLVGGAPVPVVPEHGARLCHVAGPLVDVPRAAPGGRALERGRRAGGVGVPVVAAQRPHGRACSRPGRGRAGPGDVASTFGGVDLLLPLARGCLRGAGRRPVAARGAAAGSGSWAAGPPGRSLGAGSVVAGAGAPPRRGGSRGRRPRRCWGTCSGRRSWARWVRGRSVTRPPRCGRRASVHPTGPRTGFGTAMRPHCCSPAPPNGWSLAGWATPTCRPRWTSTAGCARTRRCGPRQTGRPRRPVGGCPVSSERPPQLRPVAGGDPIWRLWQDLPAEWRGPVIGAGIENWEAVTENGERRLDLAGLPDPIPAELAWMAHWQAGDGTRTSIWALNQLANILRRARREHHSFPPSIRAMDWASAAALQGWFYATRWGRLPPPSSRARLRVVFRFARLLG